MPMPDNTLSQKAEKLLELLRGKKLKVATAESCTGGMIAALLTEIPGSSDVFERGFVTYSNEAKTEMLGVNAALITQYGAVSGEVAQAMALGAIQHSRADVSVAVTGIAGPGGGNEEKPVGLVYIATASRHRPDATVSKNLFKGSRQDVRRQSVEKALALLSEA